MDAPPDDASPDRRLPFSRAFAQAGFDRPEAEVWRLAGWDDPGSASCWRHLARWCTPEQLLVLAREGFEIDQVARVVIDTPGLTNDQIRIRIGRPENRTDDEIDLRERVLENLHLGRSTHSGAVEA